MALCPPRLWSRSRENGPCAPRPDANLENDLSAYEPLTPETLPARLGNLAAVADVVGGVPEDWRVEEVGDGNLNLVFIVEGTTGSVIVPSTKPRLSRSRKARSARYRK